MNVCVVGLGYIGFPTACLIARAGHDVVGVDVNPSLIRQLQAGSLHIVNEKGLPELARSVMAAGRLRLGTVAEPADIFLIAVPTPFAQAEHQLTLRAELQRPETEYAADLSCIAAATRSIAPVVRPGNLIVLESTVPPHTTDGLVRDTLKACGVDTTAILIAHAPERVLPGNILQELVHNDRIIGGLSPEAAEVAAEFYQSFVQGEVHVTDATTAELVKLMENTFRDVNIALANEFALVCEQLGVDVWEATRLANRHPRVNFLRPGPGVGGHCIAVDPYFVVETAPALTPLIQAARRVNRRMPLHVLDLYAALAGGTPVAKVALLGASYKADVGDDRESPAIQVAGLLAETGVRVSIHDPYVARYARPLPEVLDGADMVMLLTDHRLYRQMDPQDVAQHVRRRLLLDTRGHLDGDAWKAAGFRVLTLGRAVPEDEAAARKDEVALRD